MLLPGICPVLAAKKTVLEQFALLIHAKSRGQILSAFALQKIPEDQREATFKIIASRVFKLILWKIKGYNKPSVFSMIKLSQYVR